jgi:hypothetical protein
VSRHTVSHCYMSVHLDLCEGVADVLEVAASEGQVDVVRFLVGLGAKVNAMDDYGE